MALTELPTLALGRPRSTLGLALTGSAPLPSPCCFSQHLSPGCFPTSLSCPVRPCRLPHRGSLGYDGRAHCSHQAGTDLQRPGQQGETGSCVCHEPHAWQAAAQQDRASGRRSNSPLVPQALPCPNTHRRVMSLAGPRNGEAPDLWQGRLKLWEGISPVPALGCSPELPALMAPLCPAGLSDELQCQVCFVLLRPFQVGLSSARCAQAGWECIPREFIGKGACREPGLHVGPHWSLCSTLLLLLHAKRRHQERLAGGKVTEG